MKKGTRTPDYYANVPNVGAPGTPGKWRFPDKAPKDLAELIAKTTDGGVVAVPKTKWADGEYVPLGDGSRVRWDGTKWQLLAPVLDHIEPTSHVEKSYFDLELRGANFVDQAKVKFGARDRAATCHSAEHLTVAVTKSDTAGRYDIQVINPDGQWSGTKSLELKAEEKPKPPPVISKLDPASHVENQAFTLTVTGEHFVDGAAVSVTGQGGVWYKADKTAFKSATELSADIPTGYGAGDRKVKVTNPDKQDSNEVAFTFTAPAPHIDRLDPASHVEKQAFDLEVYGENFVDGAKVKAGTYSEAATFHDAGHLTKGFSDGWAAAEQPVTVVNPDGQESNAVTLTLTATPKPPPHISSIDPTSHVEHEAFDLEIYGSGFVDGAQTHDSSRTVFHTSGHLTAAITAEWHVGDLSISVTNPDGQVSNDVNLTLTAKPKPVPHISRLEPSSHVAGEAFTLSVIGENFVNGAVVWVTGQGGTWYKADKTVFTNATHLAAEINNGYAAGERLVKVMQDMEGSNEVAFTFTTPAPVVTRISPSTHVAEERFELRVYGHNFVHGSVVAMTGANNDTWYRPFGHGYIHDETERILTIELIGYGEGQHKVRVENPDGQKSNETILTLTSNAPHIDKLDPEHTHVLSNDTITITGYLPEKDGHLYLTYHDNGSGKDIMVIDGRWDRLEWVKKNLPTSVSFKLWQPLFVPIITIQWGVTGSDGMPKILSNKVYLTIKP